MSIGQRISECRRQFGYSQEYIAEKLNVSRQAVSKWEQDLSAPDTHNLIALAELLNVSVEYLAVGKQSQKPTQAQEIGLQSSPSSRNGLSTAKTAGLILLSMGLLSSILGFLFSRVLVTLASLFLLYGILLLVIRRYLGLILLWVSSVILYFFTHMLLPVRVVGEGSGGVSIRVFSPILTSLLVTITVFVAIRIVIGTLQQNRYK